MSRNSPVWTLQEGRSHLPREEVSSREGKLLVHGHTTRKPERQGILTPRLRRGDCAPREGRGAADEHLCPQVLGAAGAHRS